MRATFFVQGRWAEAQPELARSIADDGHLSAFTASTTHACRCCTTRASTIDVQDGHRAVLAATGVDPRPWFRCPFGAGHDDPRVLGVLEGLGYRNVYWNVVLEDWEADPNRRGDHARRDRRGARPRRRCRRPAPHVARRHGRGGRPHDRRAPGARRLLRHRRRPGDAPVSRLPAILAVDGGGSKIDAVLLRKDGAVLGAARVATTDFDQNGGDVHMGQVIDAVAAASVDAGLDRRSDARRPARRLLPGRRRLPGRRPPDRSLAADPGGHG